MPKKSTQITVIAGQLQPLKSDGFLLLFHGIGYYIHLFTYLFLIYLFIYLIICFCFSFVRHYFVLCSFFFFQGFMQVIKIIIPRLFIKLLL